MSSHKSNNLLPAAVPASSSIGTSFQEGFIPSFSLNLDTLGKFCATNGEEGLLGLITFVGNSCTYSNNQRPMLRKYIKYMDNLIDLDEDLKNDTELMRGVKFLRDFQGWLIYYDTMKKNVEQHDYFPVQYLKNTRFEIVQKTMDYVTGYIHKNLWGPFIPEEQCLVYDGVKALAHIELELECKHKTVDKWLTLETRDFFNKLYTANLHRDCFICQTESRIERIMMPHQALFFRVRIRVPLDVLANMHIPQLLRNKYSTGEYGNHSSFALAYITFSHKRSTTPYLPKHEDNTKDRQKKTTVFAFNARLMGCGDNANLFTMIVYRGCETLGGAGQLVSANASGRIDFEKIKDIARESLFDPSEFDHFQPKYLTYARLMKKADADTIQLPVQELFETAAEYCKTDFTLHL